MSLHGASYFAGVGTVVVTMAIGFGGGVMLTDAFVGKSEKTQTLLERRAAAVSNSAAPIVAAPVPQAEQQAAAPAPQPQLQTQIQQANVPQSAPVAPMAASSPTPLPPDGTQVGGSQTASPRDQDGARLEQSMAFAREADLRSQNVEPRKTAAAERRKQERRKWAERRRRDMQKVDELAAVTEKIKQIERERESVPAGRSFVAESQGFARLPIVDVFGGDD